MALTTEEINAKALDLSNKFGVLVTPLIFIEEASGEQIVGYMKNPARIVKQRALDKAMQSASEAGEILLRSSLITEESDPRILSEKPEYDDVFMGACISALSKVRVLQDQFKKK